MLAVGVTRQWRSTLIGVVSALIVLAGLVAVLGPALASLQIEILRVVVGALLLVFGLQWLRNAILRAAGYRPTRDETSIYARAVRKSRQARSSVGQQMDCYAFTVSFKSVLLEGLEVVFIVITFSVTCDVEFTDVEVNAMNLLHLRYSLQCQIFDKDLWERKRVAVLDEWTFPKITETTVSKNEHVVFNMDRPMTDLHTHFLSNDKLQAEVTLRNEETGQVEAVSRTDYISVDLVA